MPGCQVSGSELGRLQEDDLLVVVASLLSRVGPERDAGSAFVDGSFVCAGAGARGRTWRSISDSYEMTFARFALRSVPTRAADGKRSRCVEVSFGERETQDVDQERGETDPRLRTRRRRASRGRQPGQRTGTKQRRSGEEARGSGRLHRLSPCESQAPAAPASTRGRAMGVPSLELEQRRAGGTDRCLSTGRRGQACRTRPTTCRRRSAFRGA